MTEYIDPNLQAYLVSDLNAKKMMLRETKKNTEVQKYTVLDRQCVSSWVSLITQGNQS